MIRVFAAPERYIQGTGAFDLLADTVAGLGDRPAVIVDAGILSTLLPRLQAQFAGKSMEIAPFGGEVTVAAIDRITGQMRGACCDIVVGIGGGKALDAAKGVSRRLALRFVSVPTVASNDSPTATALAIYDDSHKLVALERIERSPAAVIVDTGLIACAPVRFLLSGIGDAIAKKFEAEHAMAAGGVNFHGTAALRTALIIANGCYETLREYGGAAVAAAQQHIADDALEAVVEANLLMAGIGWESGGLSIAHGLVRGISQARITDGAHGLHVAFALLVQLAFEGRPEAFIRDLSDFYQRIGLPISLCDLGMGDPSDDELRQIAERSLIGPQGGMIIMPPSAEALYLALGRIQALSNSLFPEIDLVRKTL